MHPFRRPVPGPLLFQSHAVNQAVFHVRGIIAGLEEKGRRLSIVTVISRVSFLAGILFRQPNRKPSQSLALRWTLSITVQPAAEHELGTHWCAEPFAWPLAPSRWSRTIPLYWNCGRTVESDCL